MNKLLYKFGVAYYPDYVSKQAWILEGKKATQTTLEKRMALDFERMKKSSISEIRVGEFSWSTVESKLGIYNTHCFDLCLNFAKEFNIDVIFCTPTSTPPKWLFDLYPDILPKDQNQHTIHWGSRRHYDPLHPEFVAFSKKITEFYAKSWGSHPSVVGWQIDNEFGHHGSSNLFTEHSRQHFRQFLKKKYKVIEALNAAWFTCFWSQEYGSFTEIELPLSTWADQNPHLQLDFREFCTEVYRDYQKIQVDIIRKFSPGRYVTHNLISNFYELCPWSMTKDLDVIGFDHYQDNPYPDPIRSTVNFSLMRGLGNEKPFKILEQQPVQVNWQSINRRFDLDWLLLWAAQSAMLGAHSMDYFSFQRFYGGAEQYHDGLLSHDIRNSFTQQERTMSASSEMFEILSQTFKISELPRPNSTIWVVHQTKSLWSHRICSQSTYYDALFQIDDLAELCSQTGLGIKFVEQIPSDFASCEILILPGYAFEISDEERANLTHFIECGGTLISLPRTAMKQKNNQMSPLPLYIIDSDGLYFEEYGALGPEEKEAVEVSDFKNLTLYSYRWAEKICLTSDLYQVLGKFSGGLYSTSPAILSRPLGKGRHIHLAFCPKIDRDFLKWCLDANILPTRVTSESKNVQCFPLRLDQRKYYGVVNFNPVSESIYLNHENADHGVIFNLNRSLQLQSKTIRLRDRNSIEIPGRSVLWFTCLP
jgi:beta-galactosidase